MERVREEMAQSGSLPARPEARRSGRWSATALALVIALLIGSVAIPARFTSRILALLHESHETIEPARGIESQLELDLALEATALHEYALTGDSLALAQHGAARIASDHDLAALATLAAAIDVGAVDRVAAVRRRVMTGRDRNPPVSGEHLSRAQLTAMLGAQQRSRDSTFAAVTVLESYLADEAGAAGDRIAHFEEDSLISNASLVLVALAAMLAVASLVQRERRLSALLERRMAKEAALRVAAEAFAGAFADDDLTQEVAGRTMSVLRARAAFVELLVDESAPEPQIVVSASTGLGAPEPGARVTYAGSLAEAVLKRGEPLLVPRLRDLEGCWFAAESVLADCSAIVMPLVNAKGAIGAVVALSDRGVVFADDDLATARTFGNIVSLAYEKIRLLDEGRDRRRELERVMNSRSRLIRGFSHDIKNPLGAADGYADLLATGVYGTLLPEQRESVERLRHSIHDALDLITDLHELARAETGHVALYIEPVVLRDV
jgi:signal transduction histidine kinase